MLAEKAYEPIDKEVLVVAEKVGFEPTVPCGTPDFESGTFDHSATSPPVPDVAIGARIIHQPLGETALCGEITGKDAAKARHYDNC